MKLLRSEQAAVVVVALALFTDTFLYYLLVPILPAYAKAYHLSQMGVGLLFGSYAAALLAATFPMGRMADRVGRKAPMLWGLGGLGICTLLFAFAQHYWLLVFARALQGFAATTTWTAGMALLADHFPTERRGRAMGTVFAFANLGVMVGPPVAGFLSQHFGLRAPFVLGFGLVLLDAAGRVFLIAEAPPAQGFKLAFRDLMGHRTVRVFAGAMVLGAGLWALLESVLPIHFDAQLRLSPSMIGLCFGAAALSHMLTSPLVGGLSDRLGRTKILIIGLLLSVLLIPLSAIFHTLAWVLACMVGLGITSSFIMSPVSPAMADVVEGMGSTSFGSVFGIINFAYAIGMMIGPLIGSLGVECFGVRATFIAVGLGYGAYAWLVAKVPVLKS